MRLPPLEEQDWLLGELALLVREQGVHTLVDGKLYLPVDTDFPDPWKGDMSSLEALCLRLFDYTGLGGLSVRLEAFEQERDAQFSATGDLSFRHHGAAAWFAGVDGRTVRFGCSTRQLGEAGEGLVGVMAHEVAHAWRHVHGLVRPDRDLEERLTDLTTVYFGFGVFTVNNTYRFRAYTEERGAAVYSGYSVSSAGYLSPQAMSFLFAAQIRARGLSCWQTWRLLRWLEPNQRGFTKAALRELPPTDELRERLDPLAAPAPIPIETSNRPD